MVTLMGLLGFIGKLIVKDAVETGAGIAAGAALDAMESSNTKKRKNKIKKFTKEEVAGHTRLILSQNIYKLKEDFKIYDQNENLKYIVKGKLLSATHDLSVYDSTGKIKLGQVVQKLISLRSPLSIESHPQDFVIYIKGKK